MEAQFAPMPSETGLLLMLHLSDRRLRVMLDRLRSAAHTCDPDRLVRPPVRE
jgi:hypothetical protein